MPEIIIKLGDNIVHKYFFDKEIISIGRARDNDVVIENLSVSRNHARIRKVEGKYIVTDLNSANGTLVNGVQISKTELFDNDVVTIGKHKLQFLNKPLTDEQIISDAFGAERTMIVDKTPTAYLIVTKGRQKDQEFKIVKHETSIGRSAENDIRLHDWFVSKKHAVVSREGNRFFIKDLGSWRGMMINNKQVKESELKNEDEIQFGTTSLTFRLSTEEDAAKGFGRMPKELGVEEHVAVTPEPDKTPDEEIEMAMAAAPEYEGDRSVSEQSDFEEIGSPAEDDLEQIEKQREAERIKAQILAEEKMLEDMVEGFAKLDEEQDEELDKIKIQEDEQPEIMIENDEVAAHEAPVIEEAPIAEPELKPQDTAADEEALFLKELEEEERQRKEQELKEQQLKEQQAMEEAAQQTAAQKEEKPEAVEKKAEGGDKKKDKKKKKEQQAQEAVAKAAAFEKPEEKPEEKAPEKSVEKAEEAVAQDVSSSLASEIALWESALTNKSAVIRKQAAKMLKKITGKDYNYE